eukprot:g36558.t1
MVLTISLINHMCLAVCRYFQRSRRMLRIPRRRYSHGAVHNDSCAICLDDFEPGLMIKVLPCLHGFHVDCIDPWLRNRSDLCPICKASILDAQNTRWFLCNYVWTCLQNSFGRHQRVRPHYERDVSAAETPLHQNILPSDDTQDEECDSTVGVAMEARSFSQEQEPDAVSLSIHSHFPENRNSTATT